MTDAAIISGSLVDVRNVGTHKSVKLTIHVPEEHATKVVAAFGWPTGVNPISVAVARLVEKPAQPEPERPIEARKFTTLPYAQQAALRCNDAVFRAFLREMCGKPAAVSNIQAAEAVRDICEVESRADIRPGTDAEKKWLELCAWFDAWQTKERVGA